MKIGGLDEEGPAAATIGSVNSVPCLFITGNSISPVTRSSGAAIDFRMTPVHAGPARDRPTTGGPDVILGQTARAGRFDGFASDRIHSRYCCLSAMAMDAERRLKTIKNGTPAKSRALLRLPNWDTIGPSEKMCGMRFDDFRKGFAKAIKGRDARTGHNGSMSLGNRFPRAHFFLQEQSIFFTPIWPIAP